MPFRMGLKWRGRAAVVTISAVIPSLAKRLGKACRKIALGPSSRVQVRCADVFAYEVSSDNFVARTRAIFFHREFRRWTFVVARDCTAAGWDCTGS